MLGKSSRATKLTVDGPASTAVSRVGAGAGAGVSTSIGATSLLRFFFLSFFDDVGSLWYRVNRPVCQDCNPDCSSP